MSNLRIINDVQVTAMFKALSNPHRLQIFLKLADCCRSEDDCGPDCGVDKAGAFVGEIGRGMGIVPSTVSHHIKELYHAGLIELKRNGQNIKCWVEPSTIKRLSGFFDGLLSN